VPLVVAVEAEACRFCGGRAGDTWWFCARFIDEDADHLGHLLDVPQAVALAAESEPSEDEEVPPKARLYMMNRPAFESAEQISRDTIPTWWADFIFGRKTDRPRGLLQSRPIRGARMVLEDCSGSWPATKWRTAGD
jgi:hypothetical protein